MAKDLNAKFYRVNECIRWFGDVRVIGEGASGEVVDISVARKMAEDQGLDLVEVNTNTNPHILRICKYDKFLYEQKKNAKKNKKQPQQLKEIQLSVSIAKHDLETKANQARKFISAGDKVKVVLTMKGREITRREENKKSLFDFIVSLEDVCVPEAMPKDEGNRTTVILRKKK